MGITRFNIYVPSKGRPNSRFLELAKEQGVEVTVFVEPQDLPLYRDIHKNVVDIGKNDQGIAYVRNFMKRYAGEKPYWQVDDDISQVYRREGTKLIRCNIYEAISQAQRDFIYQGVALGALDYRQFAWSATKNFIYNSFCDSFVFVNTPLLQGIQYREQVNGKEDRDMAMQVVQSGNRTARITTYAFSAPPNGSNAGGCKEWFYDVGGKEERCVDKMVELWGDKVCRKIVKPGGRVDLKIYWDNINSNQLNLF